MKYLVLTIGLLIGAMSQAQQCNLSLSGKIIDFHDGKPLFQATLEFLGENKFAATDFNGNYQVDGLCPGEYSIEVSHPECETERFEISITEDLKRDFKLEHHVEELNKVTVTGHVFHKETTSGTEASIDEDQIENYTSGSLGDALREISGVSSLNTGSTVVKPVIQGLHSSRVLIINNGVRLEDQEWGVEHAPNFDLNSASNITVVKGAGALRYGGDAVGGVIIADQRKPPVKDTLYGNTIVEGFSNGRGTSTTSNLTKAYSNGWHGKIQGTYKLAGDRESPDYLLSNTGVREKDFSVGVGLNKFKYGFDAFYSFYDAETGILRASHIGSIQDLVRSINSGRPDFVTDFTYDIDRPKQETRHHLAKFNVFKRFVNAGKWNVDYSFQLNNRREFDTRRGDDRNKASLDLELVTHNLSTNFQWDALEHLTGNFGAMYSYQENTPNPDTGIRRLIPDYEMTEAGAYAVLEYQIGQDLIIDGGFRYDYVNLEALKYYQKSRWEERGYDQDFGSIIIQTLPSQLLTRPIFDFNNFSGTLGARYAIEDRLVARVNFSSASRAPNPAELFSDGLHHSAAIIELGDLRLEQEQSFKTALSLEGEYEGFGFGINPFYNRINGFIQLIPIGLEFTNRGSFPVHEYQQTDARLFGIDVNANYALTQDLKITSSFAYVNGQDLNKERPLIDMPAPNWTNTLAYAKEDWYNLRLSLRNQTVFQQNRFPDNDFFVDYINDSGEEVTELVRVSQSPPGYSLWHFNAFMDFAVFKNSTFTVGVFVDNILNTNYRDYLNRQRFFVDDLGRNFRIQLKLNY